MSRSIERVLNVFLASTFLLLSSGFLVVAYLLYFFSYRKEGPFLYRGVRMGRNKKLFNIYKIRTLVHDAEKKIGAQLHSSDATNELWYGRFLRNSRIDEIPQLTNIIRGDMDFVGPRPVRPIMYQQVLSKIINADTRFTVHPGLTGYSQFYTPHSAPERLRVMLDNYFIRKNVGTVRKCAFIFLTGLRFCQQVLREAAFELFHRLQHVGKGKSLRDRRRYRRIKVKNVACHLIPSEQHASDGVMGSNPLPGLVIDMNREAMLLQFDVPIFDEHPKVQLVVTYAATRNGKTRLKKVMCRGTIVRKKNVDPHSIRSHIVISYQPASDLSRYSLDKYLLQSSYAN